MYTTDGSILLASLVNSLPSSTGLGITSGEASGAVACALAACTPLLSKVPITIPMESVTSTRLKDSNFCCRILLYHRMVPLFAVGTERHYLYPLYPFLVS